MSLDPKTSKKPWDGAPWTPRTWQAEALPIARRAMRDHHPVVRAVTGAGKSILLAELAHLQSGRVVVTTPTVKLVDQLAGTLKARGLKVGRFYTHSKQTRKPVTVCCNDSLASLADRTDPPGLWIVDEAHKSECDQIKDVVLGPERLDGTRDASGAWTPKRRIGFTATPYRAEESEELSLFDHLAYDYGPSEAMRDGVVVPYRAIGYEGDKRDINEICIDMIKGDYGPGVTGPGIVDAINITDAEEFAEEMRAAGLVAKAVHSRLHDSTVQRRIKALESGDLDAIVHVNMLAEGVDFPWLRWLCCRRPIGSRVLFAQYIGRGIRTYPGKKYCRVLDPHWLFQKLGLDYPSILSGGVEDDSQGIPELPALEVDWAVDDCKESSLPQETLRGIPVRIIDPTARYLTRLKLSFQSMGLISMIMQGREWREEDPTEQQLKRIDRYAWLINEPEVPKTHRRALRIALRAIEGCDRGTASDLISILNVLEYGWPEQDPEDSEVAA